MFLCINKSFYFRNIMDLGIIFRRILLLLSSIVLIALQLSPVYSVPVELPENVSVSQPLPLKSDNPKETTTLQSYDEENTTVLLSDLSDSLITDICTLELGQISKSTSLTQKVQLLCRLAKKEITFDNRTQFNKDPSRKLWKSPQGSSLSKATVDNILSEIRNVPEEEKDEEYFLPRGYDKEVPPRLNESHLLPNATILHITDKPVQVQSAVFIRNVRDVDEVNEKVTLNLDLILIWLDGNIRNELRAQGQKVQLKFAPQRLKLKTMKKGLADKIWTPDIFFEEVDEVQRPKVLDEGQIILFWKDFGAPFLRLRMAITLHCGMDFTHYPADTQKCEFHLRSSSYKHDEVKFHWWKFLVHGVYLTETSDPNFEYQVTGVQEYDDHVDFGPETPNVRKSSYLKFEFWIKRKMSYHLIQTYLPSVFFIIVTWLAFLIPARKVEVRIAIAITTLLTVTSMFSSIRENTPIVGYVKAIDIWMLTCIFFIFLTLLALTVGACVRKQVSNFNDKSKALESQDSEGNEELVKMKRRTKRQLKYFRATEHFLNKQIVICLFTLFVIVTSCYWIWLIQDSNYLTWAPNSTYNRV